MMAVKAKSKNLSKAIFLMMKVLLTQDSEIKVLISGHPSHSEPSLSFLSFDHVKDDFGHDCLDD